jgi:hypothetical protein
MGMWVRSYHVLDETHGYISEFHVYQIESDSGRMAFVEARSKNTESDHLAWKALGNREKNIVPAMANSTVRRALLTPGAGVGWEFYPSGSEIILPFWLLVLTSGSLAMILQLRWPWRFTLRHLFIVTTFLAIVLGMIACLDRSWIGK